MLYGEVHYTNGTTYLRSTLTYSCAKNYKLNGISKRHCMETGQWSGATPKCEGT